MWSSQVSDSDHNNLTDWVVVFYLERQQGAMSEFIIASSMDEFIVLYASSMWRHQGDMGEFIIASSTDELVVLSEYSSGKQQGSMDEFIIVY